jgi:hypothetical protein
MKHICVTHIDAASGLLCTEEPMRTGPAFPAIDFQYAWANESAWPIQCTHEGAYTAAPKFYGICPDDADTTAIGVLEVLTEAEWMQRKRDEFYARKHYESWVFDEIDLQWNPPVLMPQDGKSYRWDESTTSWVQWPEMP